MARRGLPTESPGLDLIPVMSLVVHLVPMLLLSVRFLSVVQLPARGPVLPALEAPDQGALAEQASRVVSVEIDDEGFRVGGDPALDPRIPCTGACTPATYDYAGLQAALITVKLSHPDENRVVIAPAETVPFEVIARVIAAAKSQRVGETERPLFPEPLMAVGP